MESHTGTDLGEERGRARAEGEAGAASVVRPLRPLPAQRRRGGPRPVPELSDAYAHLSIDSLRDYRRALNEEENKASYWRRLLQGRSDVISGGGSGATAAQARLGTMLSAERVAAGRRALVLVVPAAEMPPVPQLDELWQRQVDPADTAGRETLLEDLRTAEEQLSSYRAALHVRIAEATGELIARYRAEPALCLSALPLPRPGD